ncbi:MAG TPA: murein biosynthesis integral membrane protein MurJ [Actinomycetota bacterium]|nr:murein biosynthesis integral membrane protein MurJ [Actinomycetota bacterium]
MGGKPAAPAEPLRSSRSMALGTLASRATGFLRTLIIGVAIGGLVGDAYNAANTIPNIIYELLLGGVLTSVVVPLLVTAQRDADEGEAYAQRLLTVVVIGLGTITLVTVALAPTIIRLYLVNPDMAPLATFFAWFFLPQIFFYGVGAMVGAILNVRGSFAPPMWTPVLNNVVLILTGILFIAVTQTEQVKHGHLTSAQQLLLAAGTTLGIAAQTVALLPALSATGFRLRPRFDFRAAGLPAAARLAGWVFVYVLANQAAFLVITRLATAPNNGSFTIYVYAFTLVLLPHSVVAVSVITALLPQMSRNAGQGRLDAVGADLARGLKLAAVVLVPSALAGIVLGPLIGGVLFGHRAFSLAQGRLVGATLAAYALSLVPFSAFQLQLRAFYAMRDTRTPALVNLALAAINIAADLVMVAVLPAPERAVGLAIGYSVSYIAGYVWFTMLLRRRLGPAPRAHVTRTLVRLSVAGLAAAVFGYVASHAVTDALGVGVSGSLVGIAAALAIGAPVYIGLALWMRVPEVRQVGDLARGSMGATNWTND